MNATRRRFLVAAGLTPLLVAGGISAASEPAACYDPSALPLSQRSRRRSLGYVDVSPDQEKHCSLCSFFTADAPGCGACQLLGGGAVSANGFCNSFAAKEAK